MGDDNICIECGEYVSCLCIEYSEGNIKLNRCEKCGHAADKYIEYELALVLIDVVLHRKQAFRHLYFNRRNFWLTNNPIILVYMVIVVLDVLLKSIVLHKSYYSKLSVGYHIIHVLTNTIFEQFFFIIGFSMVYFLIPSLYTTFTYLIQKLHKKLFLSLAFPLSFQGVSIIMQIFDTSPYLLSSLALLILSIQIISFYTVVNYKISIFWIILSFCISIVFKVSVRLLFYDINDIFKLGIIA